MKEVYAICRTNGIKYKLLFEKDYGGIHKKFIWVLEGKTEGEIVQMKHGLFYETRLEALNYMVNNLTSAGRAYTLTVYGI